MIRWTRLGILGAVLVAYSIFIWRSAANSVQVKWDDANIKAMQIQKELADQSAVEQKVLNEQVFELQVRLENAELNAERVKDELQDAINSASVVTEFSVSTSDGCAVVSCPIPDVRGHYRLFNCGISNTSCKTVPDASETDLSDGAVRNPYLFATMDGYYGRIDKDYSF